MFFFDFKMMSRFSFNFKSLYQRIIPLNISDIDKIVTDTEDPSSEYYKKRITFLNKNKEDKEEIGYIEYKPNMGKICLFFITNERYRNRGLGTQILNTVLDDIKTYNTKRVWLVTSKHPHPFWEKNGFSHTEHPDSSVTMSGYTRTL